MNKHTNPLTPKSLAPYAPAVVYSADKFTFVTCWDGGQPGLFPPVQSFDALFSYAKKAPTDVRAVRRLVTRAEAKRMAVSMGFDPNDAVDCLDTIYSLQSSLTIGILDGDDSEEYVNREELNLVISELRHDCGR